MKNQHLGFKKLNEPQRHRILRGMRSFKTFILCVSLRVRSSFKSAKPPNGLLTAPLRETKIILLFILLAFPDITHAQSPLTNLRIIVNSNQDTIQTDNFLTLREAIHLVNGTLSIENLSDAEKSQIEILQCNQPCSRIEFNLPPLQTTIELKEILPNLTTPGLTIDGTTQPNYDLSKSPTVNFPVPIPIVVITPAPQQEIYRGLSIFADNITIRGLSLFGFTSQHRETASTPAADIFIAAKDQFHHTQPPKNVIIENNWLGIPPDESMPQTTSAFGVYVFNGLNTTIKNNRIAYHDGSGIITGVNAEKMQIIDNIIMGNGLAGMPDAIRLEGKIDQSVIRSNLLCANDGSGIFMFNPEGKVQIHDNQIKFNGRRLRRAGVYVMGSDHQIINNLISHQTGPGVVVTAFPVGGSFHHGASIRNVITNNSFANLEELSIDLITNGHVAVQDWQRGDGKNPQRNSKNRRLDTGNAAINAPEFLAREFVSINNQVNLDGVADPHSQVQIYNVGHDGALNQVITTVTANEQGRFGVTLDHSQLGEMISAIATLPEYGTSEPAENVRIANSSSISPSSVPHCLTRHQPPAPKPEPIPESIPELQPIRLQVPNNIHFALDKDLISPRSGEILNQIAAVMQQHPTIIIELQGHTDSRASDAYNQALGLRRANNTRNYLLKKGIAPERMTIRSFGERQLKTPGRDRLEHAYNRRVEVIFLDIRGVEIILTKQDSDLQIEP